ncbi:hypothetical protein DFH09DRAFT_1277423 [Mycena vulgaris]|nr:hypothetical protein DFH09DRAFT_1277423 [Mycena vulgaris]
MSSGLAGARRQYQEPEDSQESGFTIQAGQCAGRRAGRHLHHRPPQMRQPRIPAPPHNITARRTACCSSTATRGRGVRSSCASWDWEIERARKRRRRGVRGGRRRRRWHAYGGFGGGPEEVEVRGKKEERGDAPMCSGALFGILSTGRAEEWEQKLAGSEGKGTSYAVADEAAACAPAQAHTARGAVFGHLRRLGGHLGDPFGVLGVLGISI